MGGGVPQIRYSLAGYLKWWFALGFEPLLLAGKRETPPEFAACLSSSPDSPPQAELTKSELHVLVRSKVQR